MAGLRGIKIFCVKIISLSLISSTVELVSPGCQQDMRKALYSAKQVWDLRPIGPRYYTYGPIPIDIIDALHERVKRSGQVRSYHPSTDRVSPL